MTRRWSKIVTIVGLFSLAFSPSSFQPVASDEFLDDLLSGTEASAASVEAADGAVEGIKEGNALDLAHGEVRYYLVHMCLGEVKQNVPTCSF